MCLQIKLPRTWVQTSMGDDAQSNRSETRNELRSGDRVLVKWGDSSLRGNWYPVKFVQGRLVCLSVPLKIDGKTVRHDVGATTIIIQDSGKRLITCH